MSSEKRAFIFPGQGSQYVGMGKEFCDNFKVAREVFEEADEALSLPISKLCFEGPEDQLKLTENTQPAILTVSVACLRVLQSEKGLVPAMTAGHSLGEYSALVASGALRFADAVRVVRLRGRFMQEAVPEGMGKMSVILGLDREALGEVCDVAGQGEIVSLANLNCPRQIVIAGPAGFGHPYWLRVGQRGGATTARIILPNNWEKLIRDAEEDLGPIPFDKPEENGSSV
jgi:[acyl-carrier-protein] S-malonyltransferase